MNPAGCAAPQGYALMVVPMQGAHPGPSSYPSPRPQGAHALGMPAPPAAFPVAAEDATTCILRNLPETYTTASFVAHLDAEGFSGLYDFAYLPRSFETGSCFGYGFVNFACREAAERFLQCFEGFDKWFVPYQKTAVVSWSEPYQGLDEHIARYRDSPMMHHSVPDDYKPMLFRDGVRVPFPPPTRRIKAPRVRRARGQ